MAPTKNKYRGVNKQFLNCNDVSPDRDVENSTKSRQRVSFGFIHYVSCVDAMRSGYLILSIFFIRNEMHNLFMIINKAAREGWEFHPSKTKSYQCKKTPLYTKLYTNTSPNSLKLLHHKTQVS